MKCAYCSKEIEPGTGIMFVRKNGTIKYYCSNRCYKLAVIYGRRPLYGEAEPPVKAKAEEKA